MAYVKKAPRKRLIYKKNGHLLIEVYSDSNYAGDRGDRKSTFGYCTLDLVLNMNIDLWLKLLVR